MTEVRRKRGRKVISVEEILIPEPAANSMIVALPHALSHMPLPEKTKNSKASLITPDPTHGFGLFSFGGVDPEAMAKPLNSVKLFDFAGNPVSPHDQTMSDPSKAGENQATPGNKRRLRKPRRKY